MLNKGYNGTNIFVLLEISAATFTQGHASGDHRWPGQLTLSYMVAVSGER